MRLKGTVTVECIIDVHGAVRDVRVVRSMHDVLNDAVVNAIRRGASAPETRNGDAVSTIFPAHGSLRLAAALERQRLRRRSDSRS